MKKIHRQENGTITMFLYQKNIESNSEFSQQSDEKINTLSKDPHRIKVGEDLLRYYKNNKSLSIEEREKLADNMSQVIEDVEQTEQAMMNELKNLMNDPQWKEKGMKVFQRYTAKENYTQAYGSKWTPQNNKLHARPHDSEWTPRMEKMYRTFTMDMALTNLKKLVDLRPDMVNEAAEMVEQLLAESPMSPGKGVTAVAYLLDSDRAQEFGTIQVRFESQKAKKLQNTMNQNREVTTLEELMRQGKIGTVSDGYVLVGDQMLEIDARIMSKLEITSTTKADGSIYFECTACNNPGFLEKKDDTGLMKDIFVSEVEDDKYKDHPEELKEQERRVDFINQHGRAVFDSVFQSGGDLDDYTPR